MNKKNTLIEKLLKVAKKHKILTYPVLALVAIISFANYFFSWSHGAGKRIVAVIMVMIMLVSQSYFLTSSATELVDDENAARVQKQLQGEALVQSEDTSEESTKSEDGSLTEKETTETDDKTTVEEVPPEDITTTEGDTVTTTENNGAETTGSSDTTTGNALVETPPTEATTEVASDGLIQAEETESVGAEAEEKDVKYQLYYEGASGPATPPGNWGSGTLPYNPGNTYNLSVVCADAVTYLNDKTGAYTNGGCYEFKNEWFLKMGDSTPVDVGALTPNANGEIKLYCKRTLVKYRVIVYDTEKGMDTEVSYAGKPADGSGIHMVDVADPTLTLSDISRTGYNFSGILFQKGSGTVQSETDPDTGIGTASITFAKNENLEKQIALDWVADTYDITYAKSDKDGAPTISQQGVQYDDSSARFFTATQAGVEKKVGYKFDYWTIGKGEGAPIIDPDKASIIDYQKSLYTDKSLVLYPHYKYDEIVTNVTEISFNYDTSGSVKIRGAYTGSAPSKDNKFKYEVVTDPGLAGYGISATPGEDENGGYLEVKTDGPTNITSASLNLLIKVTDMNDGTITDGKYPFKEQGININVKKCPVVLVPKDVQDVEKTYDGTDTVNKDFSKSFTVKRKSDGKEITGVTIDFENPHYESPNAGNQKILLESPAWSPSTAEDCYELEQVAGGYYVSGKITSRIVRVKTTTTRATVRTGERNPVECFNIVELREAENSTSEGSMSENDFGVLSRNIEFTTDRRNLMEIGEDYKIDAQLKVDPANPITSNYKIYVEEKATFDVIQESPDGRYTISGMKSTNNPDWYYAQQVELLINAGENYDTINLSKDGSTVWKEGSAGDPNIVEELDKVHEIPIYVQLMDKATGAVTGWQQISIKVDQTAPEFEGYTVYHQDGELHGKKDESVFNGEQFFTDGKSLQIGNFFKNTIDIEIVYKDETSGLSKLYCDLYEQPINFSKGADGTATAKIRIMALDGIEERIGEIHFKAMDVAGNESSECKLTYNGSSTWIVEKVGPQIDSFTVKYGKDHLNTVADADKYYSNCRAYLEVSDIHSGMFDITWHVNDTDLTERLNEEDRDSIKNAYTFTKDINNTTFPCEDGKYTVSATVTDNAGNEKTVEAKTFYVDDEPPVVENITVPGKYDKNAVVTFDVYDKLSGVATTGIGIEDENGNICDGWRVVSSDTSSGVLKCELDTSKMSSFKNGTYYIIAIDKAGNVTNRIPIDLTKISSEVPECPDVTVTGNVPGEEEQTVDAGKLNNTIWFAKWPEITIKSTTETENDKIPVYTQYRMWENNQQDLTPTKIEDGLGTVTISKEGIYHLQVECETAASVQCVDADKHLYDIQVDGTAPKIDFTTSKGNGSTLIVDFTITDNLSGVNKDSIKILHGTRPITAKIEETETGYKGSFEIRETGNYTIHAADIAGNVSDAAAFTPMSMKIKAVTNITSTGATLGANVMKGTFDIASASLSYRKYTDTEYKETEAVTTKDENGNVALSAALTGLESGIAYVYKVVATSVVGEVLIYEGYFKTLPTVGKGISITGTARYANNAKGTITVGLFEGNVCVMAKEVNAGEEFTFDLIPDGNYNIVATDGIYTKTVRLLVKDGTIIYPEKYIELILSGKNTSVEITTDETPDITADNMDSIFEDDNVNFNNEDKALIEAGGTVEFKLYATLMKVSSVSAQEIAAMYAVTDKNKVVGAYLDLSLYKIRTNASGDTEKSRVTKLASGANISVTIPLGDLAGKPGLEVVRIHNEGENFLGASLMDQDTNPNTYTVTTNQFSTYAVLYSVDEPTTEPKVEPTTEQPTTEQPTTEQNANSTTEQNKDKKPGKKPDKDSGKDEEESSTVGSLKSPGSAKTGDATPIALLGSMMLCSLGGLIILRKKSKKIK